MSAIKGKIIPIALMWLVVLALVFTAKYLNQFLNIEIDNSTNVTVTPTTVVIILLGAGIGGVWCVLSHFDESLVFNAILFIFGAVFGAILGTCVGWLGATLLIIVAQIPLVLIIGTAIFTTTYLLGIYIKSKKEKI